MARKPSRSWGLATIYDRQLLYRIVIALIRAGRIDWLDIYGKALGRPGGYGVGYQDNFRAGRISRRNAATIATYLDEHFPDAAKELPIPAPPPKVNDWDIFVQRHSYSSEVNVLATVQTRDGTATFLVPPVVPGITQWELPVATVTLEFRSPFDCTFILIERLPQKDFWTSRMLESGKPFQLLPRGEYTFELGIIDASSNHVLCFLPTTFARKLLHGWTAGWVVYSETLDDFAYEVLQQPRARIIAISFKGIGGEPEWSATSENWELQIDETEAES